MSKFNVSWNLIGCNDSGPVTHTVSESIQTEATVTERLIETIRKRVKIALFSFGYGSSSRVTYDKTTVINSTGTSEQSMETSCAYYPDGSEFKGGCMWQMKMEVTNFIDNT